MSEHGPADRPLGGISPRTDLTAEQRAAMAWSRIAEPDDRTARAMVAEHGLVEALELARAGISGRPRASAERFQARLRQLDIDHDLDITGTVGARLLFPEDPYWPAGLHDLAWPPWCLWVRGPGESGPQSSAFPGARLGRSAAIVGARASTSYGEFVASELASGLAVRRFTVVSGAAFGIDAAAHRGALAVDGVTVAVLASGVDRAYPVAHTALLERIAEAGAVVSEVPPGSAPTRSRFLARNRLIAALASGTVMVEAGLRSGARSTVSAAVELCRPVGAVPGPVTSMVSAGCHEDLRAGRAQLVTDAAEVAELFGALGDDLAPVKRGESRPGDDLDPDAFRVWQSLPPRRSIGVEALTTAAGLSVAEVMAALGQLEAASLAQRGPAGWSRGHG
ncbi:MAG TPA: DNA-processing protein DprA [Ornithinimicrobium sp.]|uniref:DNA-processing protein DprA n=1 Tax=Ornithinimicrobium sp. TaxID=1977084 RepID=UPI002B48DF20|nr:DNA-processing protein DprA [Ornithinimicrobium sp.]HKJ11824.1 DNA-processing protein DprA [Ornithinimicrobium sp.]